MWRLHLGKSHTENGLVCNSVFMNLSGWDVQYCLFDSFMGSIYTHHHYHVMHHFIVIRFEASVLMITIAASGLYLSIYLR